MEELKENPTWEPFKKELTKLINCNNIDGMTNTPDYILAEMLCGFIIIHANETRMRDEWFGFNPWKRDWLNSIQDKHVGGTKV